MRILYLLLYIFVALTGILIMLYAFNVSMLAMKEKVDEVIEQVGQWHNLTLEDYDITDDLAPYIDALNYTLIIGLLAAIVGVFVYVRKRD